MKNTPFFYAQVKGGRLYFKNRKLFDDYVAGLKNGWYQLTIQEKYKPRTSGQLWESSNWNGYYWGVIIEILHPIMGLSPDDCHEELKFMFNKKGYTKMNPDGTSSRREYGGSTSDMSSQDFIDYCMKIRHWAMDPDDGLNSYIPLPHESPEALESFEKTIST